MADTMLMRMKGLLGRKSLGQEEALILRPASSIHTLFMRFPIDVVYLDQGGKVLKLVEDLKPFRFSAARGARSVIEMASGGISRFDLRIGDPLIITTAASEAGSA